MTDAESGARYCCEVAHARADAAPARHPPHALAQQVRRGHAQDDHLARGQVALPQLLGAVLPGEQAVDDLLDLLGHALDQVAERMAPFSTRMVPCRLLALSAGTDSSSAR